METGPRVHSVSMICSSSLANLGPAISSPTYVCSITTHVVFVSSFLSARLETTVNPHAEKGTRPRISRRLPVRVLQPFHDLRQRGPLAVHENADAVDARAKNENSRNRGHQKQQRKCDLPGRRWLNRDPHVHQNRREEGNHRSPHRDR